jgi:hypothetical protein
MQEYQLAGRQLDYFCPWFGALHGNPARLATVRAGEREREREREIDRWREK